MDKSPQKKAAETSTQSLKPGARGSREKKLPPATSVDVLVVEDSPTQARHMERLLEKQGFHVRLASNGQGALKQIAERKPTLVISDVVMPGMDGYELCRAIREDPVLTELPVILLTSLSEPEDIFLGLDCGADNFVAKPFDAQYLLNRIHFLIINSELRRQDRMNFGIEVFFGGRKHFVSADRVQILHHLLSTYETTMLKTRELEKVQRQLRELNAQLEVKVQERTAALQAEVEEREKAQEALAYRLHLEERLASVSNRFINLAPADLDEAIDASMREIGEAVDVDLSSLWILSPDEETAVQTHLWSRPDISPPYEFGATIGMEPYAWWMGRMRKREILSLPDLELLPPEAGASRRAIEEAGIRSLVAVPICAREGRVTGFLGFATVRSRKEWLPADVALVKVVAEVISKALEHRQGQEQIREQADLLDLATDAIVVRDMEGRILFWNRGAERLYGWQREEVLGKTAVENTYEDSQQFEAGRQALIDHGEWRGEVSQMDRSGRKLIVDKQWTLVRDAAGKPKSILSIGSDVTDRKHLESQFYQAQKQESIGSLASGIAHDFNNLLAVINGYSELITHAAGKDSEVGKFSQTILAAGKRAGALVQQILTFARKAESTFGPVEIGKMIQGLIAVIEATFPKRIKVIADLEDHLPVISGDANQIYQVLMNLLVNARDAIDESGEIQITARRYQPRRMQGRSSAERTYICVSVADTGKGMPEEVQARIFDPFFTTKAKGEGTGLGLSVVEGIVKSHGGTIEVESSVGAGTTFTACFPTSEVEPLAGEPLEDEASLPSGQKQLILVAEDEVAIREMVTLVLEQHGYSVITARDGLEAIALLDRQEKVDLILADLDMPKATGEDLLGEVQKRGIPAEFILVSGYLPQERLEHLRQAGLKSHLLKPLSIQELLSRIDEIFAAKKGPRLPAPG